jgi:hypothetical protein
MARFAPLTTLAAVAALGGALLLANTLQTAPAPVSAAELSAAPAAPASAAGPPAAAAPAVAERVYAGRSAGNEVTVAIAVKDGRAVGYVCDGDEVEAWLEGTLAGETLTLSGSGAATITGTVTDGAASFGAVSVDGTEWPFAAQGVEAPAGLYEGRADVRGVATRIGWIVDGAGNVTGVTGVAGVAGNVTDVAGTGGQRRPAPALDPAEPEAVTLDGEPVAVTALDGADAVIGR